MGTRRTVGDGRGREGCHHIWAAHGPALPGDAPGECRGQYAGTDAGPGQWDVSAGKHAIRRGWSLSSAVEQRWTADLFPGDGAWLCQDLSHGCRLAAA